MSAIGSQITSLASVYPTVHTGTDQRKHESSASLAFVRRIHRWPVNSPHKGPVTRKLFPFDDVIMCAEYRNTRIPRPRQVCQALAQVYLAKLPRPWVPCPVILHICWFLYIFGFSISLWVGLGGLHFRTHTVPLNIVIIGQSSKTMKSPSIPCMVWPSAVGWETLWRWCHGIDETGR